MSRFDTLYGSNIFPAYINVGAERVQLGEIVRRAFADSGMTQEEWNDLTEREREHKLVDAYYDMLRGPGL